MRLGELPPLFTKQSQGNAGSCQNQTAGPLTKHLSNVRPIVWMQTELRQRSEHDVPSSSKDSTKPHLSAGLGVVNSMSQWAALHAAPAASKIKHISWKKTRSVQGAPAGILCCAVSGRTQLNLLKALRRTQLQHGPCNSDRHNTEPCLTDEVAMLSAGLLDASPGTLLEKRTCASLLKHTENCSKSTLAPTAARTDNVQAASKRTTLGP